MSLRVTALILIAMSAHSTPATHHIDELAWFAGSWATDRGATHIEEFWTRPAGGTMIGLGRSVRDNKTVSFEFLRIEERTDGIYYVAQPQGRPPVDFRLDATDTHSAIFINPGHADHLKRIVYRRNADGTLTARIEGADNGKSFVAEYMYKAYR